MKFIEDPDDNNKTHDWLLYSSPSAAEDKYEDYICSRCGAEAIQRKQKSTEYKIFYWNKDRYESCDYTCAEVLMKYILQ